MPLWSLWLLGWSGFTCYLRSFEDFPGGSDAKASVYNAGDLGSSPGLGRSPGEGTGNPLQYYCLENPMDRGAWQASLWGPKESNTTERFHFHLHLRSFGVGLSKACYAMLCYAKSFQLCPTLCDPTDGSPPGSPVPGLLQARNKA